MSLASSKPPVAVRPAPPAGSGSGLRIGSGSPSAAPSPAAQKCWSDGVALAKKGRLEDAAAAYERAIKLAPGVSLYWLNLASVRRKQQQIDEAVRCARRAFEMDRHNLLACQLLVELLRGQNRHAQALMALRQLHPSVTRDLQHHVLEGALLMSLGEWQEAAITFLQVLSLKPTHIDAYMQLGFALANLRQHAEASECFRTIVTLQPDELGAAIYSAHYNAWACDWTTQAADEARLATALDLLAGSDTAPAFSPFCVLSLNDDAAMHRRAASLEAGRIAREMRAAAGAWTAPKLGPQAYPVVATHARCRIGLMSADFRTHATSILLVQVLELLDRDRFEVLLYSHGVNDGSPLYQRIKAAADHFVDCAEMTSVDEAERIRADGVSILIDLSGYTQNTRLGVMALRPAPIQVLWLAYPSTTGSDFVDYIIGDPILTPLKHQADFSEQIAQLPVCYEPTDRERMHPAPLTRAECGLPEDGFVFACFNQSYKITEATFDGWCRILTRVPASVLWLLVPQANVRTKLRAAAEARGVDPARILFADFVNPERHLARLPRADLFLDTFPYGAHTTCSDALWMGLPVLTRIGRSFSARVAASLLSAVGLPELAADSAERYEDMAVTLANDAQIQADIRAHLDEQRMNLPLFDSTRFTHELGDLFGRMAGRWQQGLPPAQLPAAGAHTPTETV